MLGIDRRVVQNFDWVFLGIVAMLLVCAIVNLMSATGSHDGISDVLRRQLAVMAGASGSRCRCTRPPSACWSSPWSSHR